MMKVALLALFLTAAAQGIAQQSKALQTPLDEVEVLSMVMITGDPTNQYGQHMIDLAGRRGVSFAVTDEYEQRLRAAGIEDALIVALRAAKIGSTTQKDAAAQARWGQVLQHVARARS